MHHIDPRERGDRDHLRDLVAMLPRCKPDLIGGITREATPDQTAMQVADVHDGATPEGALHLPDPHRQKRAAVLTQGAAGPDMGAGAGAAGNYQQPQGGADDDVVDGDYREV